MWVTYTPEGEAERRWEFQPRKIREARAEMIERRAEKRFEEWVEDLLRGGARARRVLLWHLLTTHEHPSMRFEDVDFARDELLVEHDAEELGRLRDGIADAAGIDETTRSEALAEVDKALEEARAKFGDGESGKAA